MRSRRHACQSATILAQTSQSQRKSTLNILVRTDAESPMLWPPDAKNWLTGKKTPDAGED